MRREQNALLEHDYTDTQQKLFLEGSQKIELSPTRDMHHADSRYQSEGGRKKRGDHSGAAETLQPSYKESLLNAAERSRVSKWSESARGSIRPKDP